MKYILYIFMVSRYQITTDKKMESYNIFYGN